MLKRLYVFVDTKLVGSIFNTAEVCDFIAKAINVESIDTTHTDDGLVDIEALMSLSPIFDAHPIIQGEMQVLKYGWVNLTDGSKKPLLVTFFKNDLTEAIFNGQNVLKICVRHKPTGLFVSQDGLIKSKAIIATCIDAPTTVHLCQKVEQIYSKHKAP
jgi:hypothetical protein